MEVSKEEWAPGVLLLLLRAGRIQGAGGKPSAPRVTPNSFVDEAEFKLNLKRRRHISHFQTRDEQEQRRGSGKPS